ncbi:hypothetical protein GCM10023082_10370 [Streptomyces tremellae]|uniref:Glycosyl hydrolases family 38 C-terminal domain-containing protein n=1 Tax=Streptomyces tremellae TaxID=1124239 RepID=A0ABP7E7H1_9ACTN
MHRQAEQEYEEVRAGLEAVIADAAARLGGPPGLLNSGPYARRHTFGYALLAGAGFEEAIAGGYALNLPLRLAGATAGPLVALDRPDAVAESVKLADDRGGDVVVRLYEACGGAVRTRLTAGFPLAGVFDCDLLEHPERELAVCADALSAALRLRPFRIRTLRLRPAAPAG